jgi:hypothetical protein
MRLPRACRARRGFPHSPPPSEHPTPLQASRNDAREAMLIIFGELDGRQFDWSAASNTRPSNPGSCALTSVNGAAPDGAAPDGQLAAHLLVFG